MFDRNGYAGARQVIDVSGDGANNQGMSVEDCDAALARGIVINGLPIMLKRPNFGYWTSPNSTSTTPTASSAARAPSWCRSGRGTSSDRRRA